jgi:hypothetical protein
MLKSSKKKTQGIKVIPPVCITVGGNFYSRLKRKRKRK